MRPAGVTFVAIAAGAVFLPPALTFLLIAIVVMVGLFAVVTGLVERRHRVPSVQQRLDLHETQTWLEKVRVADSDLDEGWTPLLRNGRATQYMLERERLRNIEIRRIPGQRIPGGAS